MAEQVHEINHAELESDFDPVLLVVMSNAIQAVCRQMTNTMLRSARSSVLATGRDFSCSVVSASNQMLDTAEALPIHVIGSDMLTASMQELHPDLAAGDAFLHNDPYLGNTHAADHTILVPVFVDGVHVFTACAKGHQADIGISQPTTYMPAAQDVYEEGALIFPCVRIQREYADVEDIIRMCRRRIRVPEIWYGDYLAALGAARIGERALTAFVLKYGHEKVQRFLDEWFAYSERRMMQAIRELPAGEFTATTNHDPFPGVPDGVPLKITIRCDPDEARITADLRDNPDCVPAGFNISEACARGAVLAGIFNTVDPTVPHNDGAFRRVEILLRENCVAGSPRHPASCSTATTNITDRIINLTQSAFAQRIEGWGLAEGPTGIPPTHSVIYGQDPRHQSAPYITQLLAGTAGGPASATEDGWLSYLLPVTAGVLYRDSIEVIEQKFPIIIKTSMVRPDSEGAGRFRGAPGAYVEYGPLLADMGSSYSIDGMVTPPKGVRGGGGALPTSVYRRDANGTFEELSEPVNHVTLAPKELLGTRTAGGGGYGPARDRATESVLKDVRDAYISAERARNVYGVAVLGDVDKPETLRIDEPETRRLRDSSQHARPARR